jgi:DNA-binding NarL/FixJ family response regulator
LVVQNHTLLASALARILEGDSGLSVCGIARTGADAAAVAAREKPGVVLMDFCLPDMSGPAAAAMIHTEVPGVPIVFHSTEDSEVALLDAIDVGATAAMSRRLGIAAHTIEWHVRHVIEKLQVHSKLQAVIAAARLGLIDVAKS